MSGPGLIGLAIVARNKGDNAGYAAECILALALKPGFAPALGDLEAAEFSQHHDTAGSAAGRAFFVAKESFRSEMGKPDRSILAADDAVWRLPLSETFRKRLLPAAHS